MCSTGPSLNGHRANFLDILTLIFKKDSIVRTKLEGLKYA